MKFFNYKCLYNFIKYTILNKMENSNELIITDQILEENRILI